MQQLQQIAARAEQTTFGIEPEICILDVETTGLSPEHDAIIEIAIARMRGPEIIDEFSQFVNPGRPIPREISELTHITDADVARAPGIDALAPAIRDFVGDLDVVAHNAAFDRAFVQTACGAVGRNWLDSQVFLRVGLPRLRSYRLEDLMASFAPDLAADAHRAIVDVRALARMWRCALVAISMLEPAVIDGLVELYTDHPPERNWFQRIADLYGIGAGTAAKRLKAESRKAQRRAGTVNLRGIRSVVLHTDDCADELHDICDAEVALPDADSLTRDFSAQGLAGRMYTDFEPRAEQTRMAHAVRDAFADSRHLAVEAGTGVGKSLAYLIPAARLAMANRLTVGVATKTNTLTDQLMSNELPALAAALAAEGAGEFRYTALKGYEHYLCLRKLDTALHQGRENTDLVRGMAQLLSWVSLTPWGELDEANLGLSREMRREFTATSTDCTRRKCPYYRSCYVHGARRRARSAHLVVTNHSLLFRNADAEGRILPPIRFWAIDEAHGLEDEARKQLSLRVDQLDLAAEMRQAAGVRGIPERLLRKMRRDLPASVIPAAENAAEAIKTAAGRVNTLAETYFAYVVDACQVSGGGGAAERKRRTVWLGPELRDSTAWSAAVKVGGRLYDALQELIEAHRVLVVHAKRAYEDSAPDEVTELSSVSGNLFETLQSLQLALDDARENRVYSLYCATLRGGVVHAGVEIACLEVGAQVAESLYAGARSVVCTSATLAVGSSFKRFADGIGLNLLRDEQWSDLQLASSYDLERQMQIYVATDLPEPRPGTDGYRQQLQDLLYHVHCATGGGVLTLFSSYRELQAAFDALRPRLQERGLPLLAQGGLLSRAKLRDLFIADRHASLLATRSFAEGFDARGETLRCVVIAKLPFEHPDDPLSKERNLQEGSAAWRRYDLPDMILRLKQSIGRLIRSSTDTGCVIIADPRVVSKNYGKTVCKSFPVAPQLLPADEIVSRIAARSADTSDLS
ncbi:MAG: DNA polymerase III subunit epsilon [Actinomycetes bacterium]|jgi:ATP-dependent DNA helicase DinG|nr:DNA polymerase III subunit epsilon [Actinomycetes bacterium]